MHIKAQPDNLPDLFSSLYPTAVRVVQRMVGSRETAEDLVQEAFLRILGRAEQNPGYLLRTAQNLAIDYLRSQKVRQRYADSLITDEEEDTSLDNPQQQLETRQTLDRYLTALESLPVRTQQAFLLNRLDGMTYQDIAHHLGVSISTVEKDIIRVLKACSQAQDDQ